jgi:hypothetical protein
MYHIDICRINLLFLNFKVEFEYQNKKFEITAANLSDCTFYRDSILSFHLQKQTRKVQPSQFSNLKFQIKI